MELTWDRNGFTVNGERAPFISGEFHYFRVPKKDWKERLLLLKASGANAVATYIPWIIHEPEEGRILFDDIPERSLTDFLSLCNELGVMVIARPGPYAYSELRRDGLPFWLGDNYPELLAHGPNGESGGARRTVSYLHPLFLEKARRYLRAVAEKIRPFLAPNGGCVVMVQADNEIGGAQIWRGYLDCNREGMGIGAEDGHYVRFLREKYGDAEHLNRHYGTAYAAFTEVDPFRNTPKSDPVCRARFETDYVNFYRSTLETYIHTICEWFAEDGLNVPYCTNAGGANWTALLRDLPAQNARHPFLLGVDSYYCLSPAAGISMTPEKTVRYLGSLDQLRAIGMPPMLMELQSGSMSCYPPILADNLQQFYMTYWALGMKGANYYVFTGGPNFENTGANTDVYDYHAPVSATGEIRPLYYAQKQCNAFAADHPRLLSAEKVCDVQIGFRWEAEQFQVCRRLVDRNRVDGLGLFAQTDALKLSLALAGWQTKLVEIGDDPDPRVPLILPCDDRMSAENQRAVIRFLEKGGDLILLPVVPELDEDLLPCTLLRDYIGAGSREKVPAEGPVLLANGERVYDLTRKFRHPAFGGEVLARNEADGAAVVVRKQVGAGHVTLLGASFDYNQYCQADLLRFCLSAGGFSPRVETGCHELIASLYEDRDGAVCFLINSFTGAVTARVSVVANGKKHDLGERTVPAETVLPVFLDRK